MSHTNQSLHEQKIQSTAQELSENGYTVSIEPSKSDLPFDLGGYSPDLIASKNEQGIILEVKTSLKRLSVDRFQNIAERVASHAGWRFLLITLDDESEKIFPLDESVLPSWDDLDTRLLKINTFIQESFFEPAILFLWSILEAALRKRAMAQHIPIERFPISKLLNHIYSSGEISILDFDLFNNLLKFRNKIAHGIVTSIDLEMLKSSNNAVQSLVKIWKVESHNN